MSRMLTMILTLAFAAMPAFAALPTSGSCSNFTVPAGDQSANRPDQSSQLKIENFTATKNGNSVNLSVTGITNQFPGGAGEGNDSIQSFAAWYVIQKCDVATGQFTTITDITANTTVVAANAVTQFTLTDSNVSDSKYYYVAYAVLSAQVFGSAAIPSTDTTQERYDAALAQFANGGDTTKITWATPLYAEASFLPEQTHLVYNSSNSANFNTAGNFISTAATQALTPTSVGGASATHTFKTTFEAGNAPGTDTFGWTYTMSYNGSPIATPAGFTFTPNNDMLSLAGSFVPTQAGPGQYTVSLVSTVTSTGGGNLSATTNVVYVANPRTIDFDRSGTIDAVEIGAATAKDITIARVGGFGDGTAPADFVTVSWTVSNISSDSLSFNQATTSGNSATFNVQFPDVNDLVGNSFSFTLTAQETCNAGAPAFCAGMVQTTSKTLSVVALGHNFTFGGDNRTLEQAQGDFTSNATYRPIWINSNQSAISDFTNYVFQAVNMKSGISPLTTATMAITSFMRGAGGVVPTTAEAVANGQVSAAGLTLTTNSTSASATLTKSGNLTVNDTFKITITANSSTSTPNTTSVTIAFIVLEAQAPSIVASDVLDNATDMAFMWPDGKTRSGFPARAEAKVRVAFDEDVTGPQIQFGGASNATSMTQQSSTTYTYVATTGQLQGLLGSSATTSISLLFSGATDSLNVVRKNTQLDKGPKGLTLLQAPTAAGGAPTGELERDFGFSVAVSEQVTNVDPARITNVTGLGDFSVVISEDGRAIEFYPLPGKDIGTATNATLRFEKGSLFNSSGVPNVTSDSIDLTFAADTEPPALVAESVDSNLFQTAVTYVLTFNETLGQGATAVVTNWTDGTTMGAPVVISGNTVTITTGGLSLDKEYQFLITGVRDASENSIDLDLEPFITLSAQDVAEVQAEQNFVDTGKPEIFAISPDFRIASNQSNVPLRPLFFIEFSEKMAVGTTQGLILSTSLGGNNIATFTIESFDGFDMVVVPNRDLSSATKYWLSFNEAVVRDVSGNSIVPVTYTFTTIQSGANVTQSGPEFFGSNLSDDFPSDIKPRFFFSETVNKASLTTGIVLRSVNGNSVVSGAWSIDGSDAIFNTKGLIAGQSYSWTVYTSRVQNLNRYADSTGLPVSESFSMEGGSEIRDFQVDIDAVGATIAVTATWLAPLNRAGITGYTLTAQKLNEDFNLVGSPTTVGTITSLNQTVFRTSGNVSGFAEGDNFVFTLNATAANDSVVTSEVVEIYAVAAEQVTTKVSVISKRAASVGGLSATGEQRAAVTIKPGALKKSTNISVSSIDGASLKAKEGGGERVSFVTNFGPDGLKFKEPVEIALRVDTALQTLAPSCATTSSSTCAVDLLAALNPLTFDRKTKQWSGRTVAKGRVQVVGPNTAFYYAKTPHFSAFVVAQAFSFASTAPANNAQLASATVGTTTYTARVPLTNNPNANNTTVSFTPNTVGFTSSFSGNDVVITAPSGVQSVQGVSSVAVSIRVTDSSNNTTTTRNYTIPVVNLRGDANFQGTPVNVSSFGVQLVTSSTARLTWALPASDLTSRTVDRVYVEFRNTSVANSTVQSFSANRAVTTTDVTVTAGSVYQWTIYTKSANNVRSAASGDLVRFSFGVTQTLANADGNFNVGGLQLAVAGVAGGEALKISKLSTAQIQSLTGGASPILASTSTLNANGLGTVEFLANTFLDLAFDGATASVSYTMNRTGDFRVYHYRRDTGVWEKLGDTFANNLRAVLVDNNNNTTTVTIHSNGAGSPFVVGPNVNAPNVVRVGGGGCSLGGEDAKPVNGLLNLLIMLLPLGLILMRKR